MSEWSWGFWRVGWLKQRTHEKVHITMGPDEYTVWRVYGGRLGIHLRTVKHYGHFWDAVKEKAALNATPAEGD